MCRPQDTVERSMKVGHFVLRLMGLQGGADNNKNHCAASKWHTEAHFQSGGISRPSPCWFCFPLCFHTRFQLQIFFPEPVDKGCGNKVPPTLSDEQVPSNPSPSDSLESLDINKQVQYCCFQYTHRENPPNVKCLYNNAIKAEDRRVYMDMGRVNTSVNTLNFLQRVSVKIGVYYIKNSEHQCQDSQIPTCITSDNSIIADLEHFQKTTK